jgi:hypothetical protein
MSAQVIHPFKQVLFAVLSLADLFLTWRLVAATGGQIYESNPIANWWLTRLGWLGLGMFKLFMTVTVAGLTVVISRFRPQVGGRVLGFACAAVAVVVAYSCYLYGALEVFSQR